MSTSSEQQLLYALRSPTTPLTDKLDLASSALSTSTSTASSPLAQLVRDWTLDTLFKLIKSSSAVVHQALLDAKLWKLLAETTDSTRSTSTSTPSLPIFVAFAQTYARDVKDDARRSGQVLRDATRVWSKLASTAMRKSTVDVALDGHEKLVEASLAIARDDRESDEVKALWEQFGVVWLRALKLVVVEAGKGGKKVPSHTLGLLPTLLPLLDALSPASLYRSSLLDMVQAALFNLDNLRRGLARETYAQGSSAPSAASSSSASTADSELLTSLASLDPSFASALYGTLPALTSTYFGALATHSANLFPLPAKATFPTPSAQKSALEVLGLGKRRELAGRWVRGVVELIGWTTERGGNGEREEVKAKALARVLAEVEEGDLYRTGQARESWEGILPSVATGAARRLEATAADEPARRDAMVDVLSAVHRLEYEVLERELARVLVVLSQTPASTSASTSTFLSLLLTHHSRSLTVPTLLPLLSDALASSPSKAPNNMLTTPTFNAELGRAINGMLSSASSIRATWENLLSPIASALCSSDAADVTSMSVDDESVPSTSTSPSPTKKRKLSPSTPTDPARLLAVAARTRIVTAFVSHLPTAALSSLAEPWKAFADEIVDGAVKDFVKLAASPSSGELDGTGASETPSKKFKKARRKSAVLDPKSASTDRPTPLDPAVTLGVEMLEARYHMIKRLRSIGLLEQASDESSWAAMKRKRRDGLRQVVEKGTSEAVVVASRTLLQQIETASAPPEDAVAILQAVLTRVSLTGPYEWDGYIRGMQNNQVPVAMWETLSRRWMVILESLSTDAELQQLVAIITRGLTDDATDGREAITRRLFERADFWEFARIQGRLRPALLSLASLPSLVSPAALLPLLSASSSSSPSKEFSSLRSLTPETLLSTTRFFPRLASFVPLEYLGRELRSQLSERALALDLWISSGSVEVTQEAKGEVQRELRSFVECMGAVVDSAPQVLSQLVKQTLPPAKEATLALYRSSIHSTLSTFSDSKSPTDLINFIEAFGDKPLSDLAKRVKKSAALLDGLTCEESAFVVLLETLASNLGDFANLHPSLADALRATTKSCLKPFGKTLVAFESSISTIDAFQLRDLLEATRAIWSAKGWIAGKEPQSDEHERIFAVFTQSALITILAQLPASLSRANAAPTCLSLLDLLSYRIGRLRDVQSTGAIDTRPFETLAACHLVFRRSFGSVASGAFDSNIVKAAGQASLPEYNVALQGVSSAVAAAASAHIVGEPIVPLEASLGMATILLRDGPDGSAKLSSAAFSEVLRHLSLLVENLADGEQGQDAQSAQAYFVVATFLDRVCGDKPMLLSRLNVSSVFALVSRVLQSSSVSVPTVSPASAETASSLYRALASTVGHIIRHRKDHVVPLFPQLVSTLAAFLSILRRPGFGSTGSAAALDEVDTGVVLGQRAEREARSTFPAWAWQGGAAGINKPEAASIGRLLGSLTTKTAATHQHKSKSNADEAPTGPTTTSLAGPLSKHAPFLLLSYLRACVHSTCPIPSALRGELEGGWYEVMDAMGKYEREALMKGFLGEDEEAERGVLRGLWKSWEKERYRG